MQIANRLAGYSLGEADLLRRAMGKKKPEEMAKQRERFVEGAVQSGYPPKKIEKIFDLLAKFAGYGFPKAHSAAYALLAYHTAYLKTHYPVEFMAALLTSVTGNTDDVVKYINECREMGIAVEPPDINVSDANFTPHGSCDPVWPGGGKERWPQRHSSPLSPGARSLGRYRSIYEFCEKVELRLLNKRVLESLIKSGAMDSLGRRAQLMAVLDRPSMARRKRSATPRPASTACSECFSRKKTPVNNDKLPETPGLGRTHPSGQLKKKFWGSSSPAIPLEKYQATSWKTCAL